MAILSDKWIRKKAQSEGMIEPFVESQRRDGCISYGLSSYGYDARVADEFKIFTNVDNAIVDPKDFADPAEFTQVLLHLAIVGGLLMTFAYGQMRGSYDYMRERRRTYDAELRAAHAEGKAEGAMVAPHAVVTDADGDGVPEARPRRRWF